MRKACVDCTRKHLAQALVISHELAWYAEDVNDRHLWVCVGHLAEAETQIQRLSQFIADSIRAQRLLLMKEGAASVHRLDINNLIGMVCEFDDAQKAMDESIRAEKKQDSVFGTDIPDFTENDSDSGE